jgi:hypothetical protein
VESRFHYHGTPIVHVVTVRVSRLARPVELPEARRYGGCVSWVELDHDVDVAGAVPVLEPRELDARLGALEHALGASS